MIDETKDSIYVDAEVLNHLLNIEKVYKKAISIIHSRIGNPQYLEIDMLSDMQETLVDAENYDTLTSYIGKNIAENLESGARGYKFTS